MPPPFLYHSPGHPVRCAMVAQGRLAENCDKEVIVTRGCQLAIVLCASAFLASCGSCNADKAPAPAPLAAAEPEALPALPDAVNPFAGQA